MEKIEREFEIEKETKNTIRYTEVLENSGMPPALKTIYIQKWLFGKDKPPAKIKVVITEVK